MNVVSVMFYILISLKIVQSVDRKKRFVYFPYGGGYKTVVGVAIPVTVPKSYHGTLLLASNVQFQYPQVSNLTQVADDLPPIITRRKRNMNENYSERTLVYMALEQIMERPDYESTNDKINIATEYLDAKKAGGYGVDCLSLYPNCPLGHGLLDIISILENY